ncbi:MAG: enoyl-[acyl-carrier-protein] reductase FabK [Oscillospiraceae bacterium]|nr:enoyl-[acyl-carrier-protein] reductase FabK [Oscillospiraceae bacterium]
MKTTLTSIIGTKYPLIQGGMAWVADANLAAAVSEAGGLGLIAAGPMDKERLRSEINKVRSMTDKPFGVNIMFMSPHTPDLAAVVIEEKVPVVTTGAGSPGKYIASWKKAGIKVIPVVASTGLARRMESLGADAVVAEGSEAGGHIGELTTMTLVPQVADSVSIPVVAAGGIADGRGIAAAGMLGASGVQVGTRFLASEECNIHMNYKALIIKSKDIDSRVTGRSGGHPVRCIKNQLTREMEKMEKKGASFEELEALTIGSLRKAVIDGDLKCGSFMAGQIAGMIKRIMPVKEIIEEMFTEYEKIMSRGGSI